MYSGNFVNGGKGGCGCVVIRWTPGGP
jgi:hypothetical protein